MFYERLGRRIVTVALVLACAACSPKKMASPLELGLQSYEAGDASAAASHFEAALISEPENAQAVYYLGRIALEAGELDTAIEKLGKAVALDDANSEYHFRLGVAYAQKVQKVSLMEKGQLAPKIKGEFERAVETDPENVDARTALAQYFLSAPPMIGGSKTKAMEQIEAIKALDPRRGHLFMARIAEGEKDYEAAASELSGALALHPRDPEIHHRTAMLHQAKKDYTAAFAAFEKTLELEPGYMPSLYQVGRTAVFSGENLERGLECLQAYLREQPEPGHPTWAHAHWRMGMLYEKMGKPAMAKKAYQDALAIDPEIEDAKKALERL